MGESVTGQLLSHKTMSLLLALTSKPHTNYYKCFEYETKEYYHCCILVLYHSTYISVANKTQEKQCKLLL